MSTALPVDKLGSCRLELPSCLESPLLFLPSLLFYAILTIFDTYGKCGSGILCDLNRALELWKFCMKAACLCFFNQEMSGGIDYRLPIYAELSPGIEPVLFRLYLISATGIEAEIGEESSLTSS